MKIRCTKGFRLDGGSAAILRGEIFKLVDAHNVFEATGFARVPGAELEFTEEELAKHFEIIFD